MECERLQRLVKAWYLQVQEETMAPARMVSFMEKHLAECACCLADPLVRQDIAKITAIILPPTKIRKPAAEEEEVVAEPVEEGENNGLDDDLPADDEGEADDFDADYDAGAVSDDDEEEDDEE